MCDKSGRIQINLPHIELDRLRSLTLSDQEYGGRLIPKTIDGQCVLVCETRLIIGTKSKSVGGEDAENYSGGSAAKVNLLSTPFGLREIIGRLQMCTDPKHYANIFWHSHPISIAPFAPPSVGDFVAHSVLGNLRNWGKQKIINTCFIVTFEGIYIYNLCDKGLSHYIEMVNTLMNGKAWGDKDLPESVCKKLRQYLFSELIDAYHQFFEESEEWCNEHGITTTGAPKYGKNKWGCKTVRECGIEELDFDYKQKLDDPTFLKKVKQFHKTNTYQKVLNKNYFYYDFIPYTERRIPVIIKKET
jgi:hypothetical protein